MSSTCFETRVRLQEEGCDNRHGTICLHASGTACTDGLHYTIILQCTAQKSLRFCEIQNLMGSVNLIFRLIIPREWAHHPLDKILGEIKGWSRHNGEKKNPWLYQESDLVGRPQPGTLLTRLVLISISINEIKLKYFFSWLDRPSNLRSPLWDFSVTLRHTTLSRTPPGKWSARRRNLNVTKYNT
jgi:hypothetical protein